LSLEEGDGGDKDDEDGIVPEDEDSLAGIIGGGEGVMVGWVGLDWIGPVRGKLWIQWMHVCLVIERLDM
jgi:hypothetical protein